LKEYQFDPLDAFQSKRGLQVAKLWICSEKVEGVTDHCLAGGLRVETVE
jgi:hypothetical protein